MWFVPLHAKGDVLSSRGPDTIHPAPSLCISSPSCLSPGGWCLCACWRSYKDPDLILSILSWMDTVLDAAKKESFAWPSHCMAKPHGFASTGPVLRLLQFLAPLISGWRNKGIAPAAWITSARFPAAPLCATHGAENATCIQKHTSLNSDLFLFVFAKELKTEREAAQARAGAS